MAEKSKFTEAMTLTFGDVAENHAGMQKVGTMATSGFSLNEIQKVIDWCKENNVETNLINLGNYLPNGTNEEAYFLHIKNGVNGFLKKENFADKLFEEQSKLEKDTKAFMYGRVVNKKARYNLCFGDEDQEPNYNEGKGRIYSFDNVPKLLKLRKKFGKIMGSTAKNLKAEGNYYYDPKKCGIGYHGDSERKKVIGVRLGTSIPLTYVWYKDDKPQSEIIEIKNINHGDIYIMSEKATGYDWKKSSIYTLRHAAGSKEYTTISEKKKKNEKK